MFLLTRSSAARAALLLGAGLSFATPIWAQNAAFDAAANNAATSPLRQALAADGAPLSLQASALDASWRRFKINKSLDTNFRVTPEANQNSDSYSYFTRGETLKVGDETFLLAYRTRVFAYPPYDDIENSAEEGYADVATNSTNPDQYLSNLYEDSGGYLRLLSTQTLHLCLLNTRTLDGLGDIRAFDAPTDLVKVVTSADRERDSKQSIEERASLQGEAVNQRVTSDLKQIGLALMQYTQDYDEKLPSMRSAQSMAPIQKAVNRHWGDPQSTTVQEVLQPYIKSAEVFAHPTTRELYRPNINVSRRNLASFDSPEQTVAFYEASPAPDGTRAVLYVDGHVKRELETNWAAIRSTSDIFAPPFQSRAASVTTNKANATITLYDAAAMAYTIKQWKKNPQHTQQLYLSKSANRVYYRDDKTHQAIWVDSPAKGITLSAVQAAPFRNYKGYNGQKTGRVLSGDFKLN